MIFCTTADGTLRNAPGRTVASQPKRSLAMILSHRLYTSTLIGLSGASVMAAMGQGYFDPAMLMVAALGAGLAGLPVASLFGGRGRDGALAALAGAVMATGLGAALAGFATTLMTGYAGAILIAPAAVYGAILSQPMTALSWAGSMAGVHLLTRLAREEAAWPARYSRK
jgi:hypothetical protein